ncbi:MAG: AMP-binding protein [Gammaproteobacteria bacterium]|nr:AMP-binding protein [Gammaproteobacteria bacterium]MBU1971039.1 AMP-binding protein [Gammaproteobacteria bacterium]
MPDGAAMSFGAVADMAGRDGLQVLEGDAATLARGIVACALGGGTAFPLPPGMDPLHRAELVRLAAEAAAPALALIIATSGSQGAPKGVRLAWRAVAAASRMSARALDLRAGDAWLAGLPLYHVGGAMILYRCLRAGATAVVHDGFDAAAVGRDLARRRITHLSLVPPMLSRLLDAGVPPAPSLRCVLVGGAALPLPLFRRAAAAGWPVCPTYGMTESCAQATVLWRPHADAWQEGDVGPPLPGVCVAAADGVLRIATPARMSGYLGQAGAVPEWLATSDMGHVDAAGHVHVSGRADDMLVSAGVNVHPLEVESRLAVCPGVREAGVSGLVDPLWGDVIAAAYEGEIGEAELEDWCRAHLPAARRPRRFRRVDALPRTASGKLDRRALPVVWGAATSSPAAQGAGA